MLPGIGTGPQQKQVLGGLPVGHIESRKGVLFRVYISPIHFVRTACDWVSFKSTSCLLGCGEVFSDLPQTGQFGPVFQVARLNLHSPVNSARPPRPSPARLPPVLSAGPRNFAWIGSCLDSGSESCVCHGENGPGW